MIESKIRSLLEQDTHSFWLKSENRILQPLITAFLAKERHRDKGKNKYQDQVKDEEQDDIRRLVIFIVREIDVLIQYVYDLRMRHAEFIRRCSHAISNRENEQYILEYAKYLGATNDQLAEDEAAFERWFRMDAMTDRHTRRHSKAERKIALYLKCVGKLTAVVLQQNGEAYGHSMLWRNLSLEAMIKPLLVYDGDNRVKIEAFRCLSKALSALPEELQQTVVDVVTTQYIYRSALESKQQVWIQCEALSLLQSLSTESFCTVLEKRLTYPHEGDDLFVRRRAVRLLGENLKHWSRLAKLFPVIAKDPSPFVRQAFSRALRDACNEDRLLWLRHLILVDESKQVRAAALLEFVYHLKQDDLLFSLLEIMIALLDNEQETFVLRVGLKVICDGQAILKPQDALVWQQKLQPSITKLHTSAKDLSIRRWAAQTREKLWLNSQPAARDLAKALSHQLQQVPPGEDCTLSKQLSATDEYLLGRVLSVLGQHDFGYDVSSGWFGSRRITRGHRFGFRLWRFIHEWRHPAPDKRQAFQHTIGRIFEGELRAPSSILAELAETKVPGEPLFISSESGWRPYLPLVDDIVSSLALKRGKTVRFFTSEGITELIPPVSIGKRISARFTLIFKFSQFAHRRNWQETSQSEPSSYIQSLRKIGFDVTFVAYKNERVVLSEDSAVRRFFV